MTDQTTSPHPEPAPTFAPLQYKRELFREYVQGLGLSPEQEDVLLDAVWAVVIGTMDFGLGAYQFAGGASDSKTLAADSASVLALLSTSKITNAEDVEAEAPIAPRTDS